MGSCETENRSAVAIVSVVTPIRRAVVAGIAAPKR
jgi:hypothetical protein